MKQSLTHLPGRTPWKRYSLLRRRSATFSPGRGLGLGVVIFLTAAPVSLAQQSVARQWNEELLDAIRIDYPAPTVHSRNLFHTSIAMYDAWAAYDPTAVGYLTNESATAGDIEAARAEAISYAAYRVLSARYTHSPNAATSLASFDARMDALGYDRNYTSTRGNSPAALGNRIAGIVLFYGSHDGANEANNYADTTGYTPVNEPLIVRLPGTTMVDKNRWQPLALDYFVTQNGLPLAQSVQTFLGSHWGFVAPFALKRDQPSDPYTWTPVDPGPPPQLGGTGDADFKTNIVSVIRYSSWLDPDDGVLIDISPAVTGNRPLGTHDDHGHPVNPVTGEPYAPNIVKRGDWGRILAEFWADGPSSETPPGHWNTIANYVADHPLVEKRIGGTGPIVNDLKWDVEIYLALNGAVHDAAVAAWGAKPVYDYVRPISTIRYMGGLGQSSDPLGPSYHPDGLPLEPGLIEVITSASTMPGERHEQLAGHEGEIAIYAWPGQPEDTQNEYSGAAWIRAVEWVPYQRSTFVTPPFAGYVSGHSTFSRSGAEVLTRFTGSEYFPGGLGEFFAEADEFLEFEIGPTEDITLQWATYRDAADEAGISRLWGGIHVAADDFPGRIMGWQLGNDAYDLAQQYYTGAIDPCEPPPDCNTNGIADSCDIAGGTCEDCTSNGIPDQCEPDCNSNGVADSCDVADQTSPDCDSNGVPDECQPDCNSNGVADSCDVIAETSPDCDSNGVPDECQPDCNSNGVADSCDVIAETSPDCDSNGVPDECQPDCNTNGVADSCDIADGTSADCDLSGVPDECETNPNCLLVFTDVTTAAGILPSTIFEPAAMARGVAAADFDDDGYTDLFVPNGEGVPAQLYHNLGGGQFVEMANSAGVASTRLDRAALWFDYDGDYDLDLLVTREDPSPIFTLYRQYAPAQFEDVTTAAGLDVSVGPKANEFLRRHRSGSCAGDINNDGYLDLCVTMWNGQARLFLNNRDATFTEITASSGLGTYLRNYWNPRMADFNHDGWQDIYISVDFGENQLWINQQDNTFVEVAASVGLNNNMNDMGVTLGDYDNDGDLDLYVTNIFRDHPQYGQQNNVLYRNDSVGEALSFTDVSFASQVANGGWGWGTTFFDADRDGWLDIGETNGWRYSGSVIDQSHLFHNPAADPFEFVDVATAVGFDDDLSGSSLIAFDYDRDGDLDLFQACMDAPSRLLANQPVGTSASHNYLTLRPRMLGPNHRAIGAIVRVKIPGTNLMRPITAGTSAMGQEPAEAFFGLGPAATASLVQIEWPDGATSMLTDVAANQMLTVTRGAGDDDADGDVDLTDFAGFEACVSGPGVEISWPNCWVFDFDRDHDVDVQDFGEFQAVFTGSGP